MAGTLIAHVLAVRVEVEQTEAAPGGCRNGQSRSQDEAGSRLDYQARIADFMLDFIINLDRKQQ